MDVYAFLCKIMGSPFLENNNYEIILVNCCKRIWKVYLYRFIQENEIEDLNSWC